MKKTILSGCAALLMAGSAVAADPDAAKGKDGFENNCSVCHNADSTDPKVGPGLKGLFKRDALINKKKVNEASVTAMINEGGNGMPPFADILTKAEKDDIIAYLKTL